MKISALSTTPKTEKSIRVIQMPQFLVDEIQDYLKQLYNIQPNDRMFTVTKSYLHHEMDRGAKEANMDNMKLHHAKVMKALLDNSSVQYVYLPPYAN